MDEGVTRTEKLLAAILLHDMRDAPQGEKAAVLSRAGLPNSEIATLLGTTSGVIAQQLYELRSKKARKKSRSTRRHRR